MNDQIEATLAKKVVTNGIREMEIMASFYYTSDPVGFLARKERGD